MDLLPNEIIHTPNFIENNKPILSTKILVKQQIKQSNTECDENDIIISLFENENNNEQDNLSKISHNKFTQINDADNDIPLHKKLERCSSLRILNKNIPDELSKFIDNIIDITPQNQLNSENLKDTNSKDSISTTSTMTRWYNFLSLLFNSKKKKNNFYLLKKCSSELDKEILGYIKNINNSIGYYWWKQYIYSGFWSYISTPINLSITVLTALTTGQSATHELLSANTTTILGGVVLSLSIFNTFFKPNDQMNINKIELHKWAECGTRFDGIYVDKICYCENNIENEKKEKLKKLQELFKDVSQLKKDNESNFIIDILYSCIRCILLRKIKLNWMPEADAPTDEDI